MDYAITPTPNEKTVYRHIQNVPGDREDQDSNC